MIKKILISAIAMTFTSCGETLSEYVHVAYYVYVNKSSLDITVDSYYIADGEFHQKPESTFIIPVGNSHTLRFDSDAGLPIPFSWIFNPLPSDYVIVSNGEKQFVNTRSVTSGNDKLYRVDSYEIIEESKKNRNRVCQYVFTDKDFENAVPIEP